MSSLTITVSRLAALLPHAPPQDSFACGMCFPYACACTTGTVALTKQSGRGRSVSPKKSFLRPINQQQQKRNSTSSRPTVASGKQTNIEVEKVKAAARRCAGLALCVQCAQPVPSAAHTTRATNAANSCRFCHIVTARELASHCTKDDLWVSISGKAYDLTKFAPSHPGGTLCLQDVAGCDASDVFKVFHPREVQARLPAFQVGIMGEFEETENAETARYIETSHWRDTPMQADFHAMIAQMERDGQFVTDMRWYWMKAGVVASLLAAAVGLVLYGTTLSLFLGAISLGMFWQQLAFLGHDLGHNSVRGSVAKDWFAGLCVTAFFGVSVQWWKRNHNVHHVVTNAFEHDPDVQYLPVFSLDEQIAAKAQNGGFHSTYHDRPFTAKEVGTWMIRHQHLLFYPVMCIARINLYAQSIILMCNTKTQVPQRAAEIGAMVFFAVWNIALLACLPNWFTVWWFFNLSHAVAGLTHIQITLSHFAMPMYEGRGYSASHGGEAREHFLRSQFATSLDIDCPEWLDWLHGGLQFQVSHHLLPRVPRHRLRHVRETYMKPFAARHGLTYHSATFGEANVMVYRSMKEAGASSDTLHQEFTKSQLYAFMQADG